MFRLGAAELAMMIPIVAIVGGIFLGALKIMRESPATKNTEDVAEDTRLLQEIHRGMQHMESRIEALETLMLDRERTPKRGKSA